MLTILGNQTSKFCDGVSRRGFLKIGALSMGATSLSLADVHLISMRREMTGIVVPGKLYGVMASARPSLFVGPEHCETADTIRESDCGYTVRQGDVDGLVTALERLAADGQLMAYRHTGFWHAMDTLRDKQHLNGLWDSGAAPWKLWEG